MKKCVKCGKEAYVVNHEGECYDCMSESDRKLAQFQYQKLKAQIEGVSEDKGNSEEEGMSKEEFEKQAEFENRMRTFVHELRKAKEEENLQQAEEEGLNVETKGTVSLRPEDIQRERGNSGNLEFDSHQQMIDYLRLEAMKGNAEAKENLERLWKKVVSGMREQPTKTNFQFGDENWLSDFKKNQTEAWKKKKGVKIE